MIEKLSHLSNHRPTLAFFAHGANDPCSHLVWSGVVSAAHAHDVNLVCFPGKPLRSPHGFEAQSNVLYDLVDPAAFDALVIWLAGLTLRVNLEEVRVFCERYRPLPIVTAGVQLPGFPGVTVDNYHGMRDVVTHLIEAHGRSRVAFIRGPENHQEAEERYRAYRGALREHGLAFDPDLVVQGDFKESSGPTAVSELLDRRRVTFDALAAASDNMAIGALKALQARGLRIPDDVAIAGLNDEDQSRIITPPLTTSPLHFFEQGYAATEIALDLINGQPVPDHVVLPTRLLIRQSCGCPDPIVAQAAAPIDSAADAPFPIAFAAQHDDIAAELAARLDRAAAPITSAWIEQLLAAFIADLRDEASAQLLPTLAELIRLSAAHGEAVSKWHEVMSILRQRVLPLFTDLTERNRPENLWQQARVLIGETAQRMQAYHAWQAEQRAQVLSEINQALNATLDAIELADVLAQTLPRLDIPRFCLSLYEDPTAPASWSHFIVAGDERGRLDLNLPDLRFPSRQLSPPGWLPRDRRYSLVVEPLYFREDQLGYLLFEADPAREEEYEALSRQLSSTLKRVRLAERNIELYNEAVQARQVAEEGRRLAEEADSLKSRFLATVSHELRTPLTLIVGTIEMMLREETPDRSALPVSFHRDLKNIRASAQHLARLIGDVLDLASSQAGELHLTREPLDLSGTLQEAAWLGELMAREKGLKWRADLPEAGPLVWGDRTRLKQVALNLISNATKFTEQGEVALTIGVEPKTVTVSVSDTGMGISPEEQEAIFDEFHQSERTTQRGYGGIGLGLAVTRRLIELHGGQIGVRSSGVEGAGSTFFFTLPIVDDTPAQPDRSSDRSRLVLLLAERAGDSTQLRDHLQRRGFEVEELALESNPDWLAQVVASPPGAIVLDLQPAEELGWELMRTLKQHAATQDVPIVFYAISEERDTGSLLEVDYLTKPVGTTDLIRALERRGITRGECQDDRKILIVDDEPGVLDLHARLVQSHVPECTVLTAPNGRAALEIMDRERPDLVLLDLMMPEIDGFHVLERMRDRTLTRDVPVIVLTAQFLTGEDMARLQHGVAVVLEKGLFRATEVLAQVEATLARSKPFGGEAQRVVRQAMAYIHEHYAEALSRQDLARQIGVSERHLNRCFHQELGLPPMTYLNRYRVQCARELLERGDQSVTEVALTVGFSDSNYFGRVFRQEVGISPGLYQRGQRSPRS